MQASSRPRVMPQQGTQRHEAAGAGDWRSGSDSARRPRAGKAILHIGFNHRRDSMRGRRRGKRGGRMRDGIHRSLRFSGNSTLSLYRSIYTSSGPASNSSPCAEALCSQAKGLVHTSPATPWVHRPKTSLALKARFIHPLTARPPTTRRQSQTYLSSNSTWYFCNRLRYSSWKVCVR